VDEDYIELDRTSSHSIAAWQSHLHPFAVERNYFLSHDVEAVELARSLVIVSLVAPCQYRVHDQVKANQF
jgi:hypothetical protein